MAQALDCKAPQGCDACAACRSPAIRHKMLGKIFGCGTVNAAKSQEVENVQASAPHHAAWTMESKDSPLFQKYLGLAKDAGWGELICVAPEKIWGTAALIVVDLQTDFIPCHGINPSGGAFGVAEGAMCSPLIVALMRKFADAGASVVCTCDYQGLPTHRPLLLHPLRRPLPEPLCPGQRGDEFLRPGRGLSRSSATRRSGARSCSRAFTRRSTPSARSGNPMRRRPSGGSRTTAAPRSVTAARCCHRPALSA